MHPRIKSTLSGLAVVTAFVLGSALVGEPLPHAAEGRAAEAQAAPQELELEADPVAQAVELGAVSDASARESNRRRLKLTMPYVSVGQLLPNGRGS